MFEENIDQRCIDDYDDDEPGAAATTTICWKNKNQVQPTKKFEQNQSKNATTLLYFLAAC